MSNTDGTLKIKFFYFLSSAVRFFFFMYYYRKVTDRKVNRLFVSNKNHIKHTLSPFFIIPSTSLVNFFKSLSQFKMFSHTPWDWL